MTGEVTAGFVCKSQSLSLLDPLEKKFSLSKESLFSTEGKGRVKSNGNRRLGSWVELELA